MKKPIKIILSLLIFPFCLLALVDILSGGEPLADELVVLSLTFTWLAYLIRPFKPPKFLIAFLVALASCVIHNVASHLLRFEEPVFFFLTLIALAASLILLIIFLLQKLLIFIPKKKK